ncbi:MAG: hypothetical protein ACJ780_10075 [Solirubrobacteraceae bacterium]|jgi:hypothetical protein
MTDFDHIQRLPAARPGPYGTNEGDLWSCEDSVIGQRIAEEQPGAVFVTEMKVTDGALQECMYVTTDPAVIAQAREGVVKYFDAKFERAARRN